MNINQIAQSDASAEDKISQLTSCLHSIEATEANVPQFIEFLTLVADIQYSRNVTKPVISNYTDYVCNTVCSKPNAFTIQLLEESLNVLLQRLVTYEKEEMRVRKRLVELLQEDEEYQRAARTLQAGLSSTERQLLTENVKFEAYVAIVRCYLETDSPELAEQPLSRAQHTRPYCTQVAEEVDLAFKLCQARIFDSNRKFLQASNKYHLLSQEQTIAEEERLQCLGQAIVCSILSPAGPLRGQALRRLYNDERSKQLDQWLTLEKVYLDRLLLASDVQDFEQHLQPHQKAVTADGTTVITKAVIEHNVMAVSKIYNNIGIPELGKFLGLEEDRAEEYTAKMIMQNRLQAKIDQVSGLIRFKNQLDDEKGMINNDYDYANGDVNGNGLVMLKQLDGGIQELCMNLEEIVTDLSQSHPEFVSA